MDGAAAREYVGAVVVAAGESRRMGGADKILAPLLGRPLLAYSLDALDGCAGVDAIVVVVSPRNVDHVCRLVAEGRWPKVTQVCMGGARRQDSVRSGLEVLKGAEWVIVHDGARPCVTLDLAERGLREARETGAAAAAVPAKDTLKLADERLVVAQTLPRDRVWMVQTPQVFRRRLIWEAHQRVREDVTDDATMIEMTGGRVRLFQGSYSNVKVTTPEDITVAEAILAARAAAGAAR